MAFRKGDDPNRSPGGMTKEQHEAQRALNKALADPKRIERALVAYDALVEAQNPVILKDFFDRVAGKPKDRLDVTSNDRPLVDVPSEALLEFILKARG